MSTPETQEKHCKVCMELKKRIANGTYKKASHKRWVDETGKQWNGHVCPDCQRKRALVNMHRLRGKTNEPSENR